MEALRLNANATVSDHQFEAILVVGGSEDFDLAAIFGEFDRVRDEIIEYLFELLLIEGDVAEIERNVYAYLDALFLRDRFGTGADFLYGRTKREFFQAQ